MIYDSDRPNEDNIETMINNAIDGLDLDVKWIQTIEGRDDVQDQLEITLSHARPGVIGGRVELARIRVRAVKPE